MDNSPMSTTNDVVQTGNVDKESELITITIVIAFGSCCLVVLMMAICFALLLRTRSLGFEQLRCLFNHQSSQRTEPQTPTEMRRAIVGDAAAVITIPEPSSYDPMKPFVPYRTTVADSTSNSSPAKSPFSAFGCVLPCPYDDDCGEDMAIAADANLFGSSLRPSVTANETELQRSHPKRKEIISDKNKDAVSSVICPDLDYAINLMDVELRELGEGAFGKVKEGIYVTPCGKVRHVAAKHAHRDMSFDSSNTFNMELDIISKLPLHGNIVRYFGTSGVEQTTKKTENNQSGCFLVMELMFTNLNDVIHDKILQGHLNYGMILNISLDIATGLDHLHEYGIIHHDLKPSNVLLNEEFAAKLADFGSSKKRQRSFTVASFRGTLGYIAPEVLLSQFVNRVKVSQKLDVYSMGVVMWEMVTGEYPPDLRSSYSSSFQGSITRSVEMLPRLLLRDSFTKAGPERCSPSLRTLIEECLDFEPSNRPTTKEIKDRIDVMKTHHAM